jgi:hypothetical protein
MMKRYFVVLIETAGNQRAIFQTNRQRENLGASELIYRVGTRYVLEALGQGAEAAKEIASDPARLDALLLDSARNPPIDGPMQAPPAEIVIATSGKAILIVRERRDGEAIVTSVTRQALRESPGVTVRGALAEVDGGTNPTAAQLDDAIFRAHLRHDELAALLPSADLRFPRLPFVEDCASSGLPAGRVWDKYEPRGPIAEPLAARRAAYRAARARMEASLANDAGPLRLPESIQDLEKTGYTWTAVAHADGNGLGGVFVNFAEAAFGKAASTRNFRDYIGALRGFSIGIDRCTRRATRKAIDEAWSAKEFKDHAPLMPLVLGGDDLTVICDGGKAIPFTVAFLRAFEEETRNCKAVTDVVPDGLSACAGIAIVKPHFPFHRAYELAEDLIGTAKAVKQKAILADGSWSPCSAFDFQIVFDTSVSDLDDIRARMTARDDPRASLTFRPYVVSDAKRLEGVSGKAWLGAHHFDRLAEAKGLLVAAGKDDGHRDGGLALPRSQQHVLREALGEGKAIADARLNEIRHRYILDWGKLAPEGSLFVATQDGASTYLLDAMDLADLEAAARKGAPQ